MFGRNSLNDYGYDFLEGHEILEDINKNHKDISENTINALKEKLQEDEGFGDVFLKYLADMEDDVYQYYIDKPEVIAKRRWDRDKIQSDLVLIERFQKEEKIYATEISKSLGIPLIVSNGASDIDRVIGLLKEKEGV